MSLLIKEIKYQDDNTIYRGYLAVNTALPGEKKPAVIVSHDWSGCNEFAQQKARDLAQLGYVGFALDMFGEGKLGKDKAEKSELIKPSLEDRQLLLQRIKCALNIV